jgi:hypothetical protein
VKSSRVFTQIFMLALFGCGSSLDLGNEEPKSPSIERPFSNVATGWINGEKWDFISGKAVIETHAAGDYLQVYLWNDDVADPCSEKTGTSLQIHLKTMAQMGQRNVGKDPFKLDPVILFKAPKFGTIGSLHNLSADMGFVALDRLGAEVVGRFYGEFRNASFLPTQAHGKFKVPLCDEN